MLEKEGRILDPAIQKEYLRTHPFDEYFLGFRREFRKAEEVHEIEFGSYRTFEDWNMISITRETHNIAHEEKISKRKFFIAKILSSKKKIEFPDRIIRKYDLGLILKNSDKFNRRWLIKIYHKI